MTIEQEHNLSPEVRTFYRRLDDVGSGMRRIVDDAVRHAEQHAHQIDKQSQRIAELRAERDALHAAICSHLVKTGENARYAASASVPDLIAMLAVVKV